MIFYMLDDIKKKLGKQLYNYLGVGLLSLGTLVLGGILVFNVVNKETVVTSNSIGGIKISAREDMNSTGNDKKDNSNEGTVYENIPEELKDVDLEKVLEKFDKEKIDKLLSELEDLDLSNFSIDDIKRP